MAHEGAGITGNPMIALMFANRRAAELRAQNFGDGPALPTVFRGAATHSGAFLLEALGEIGWELRPKSDADAQPVVAVADVLAWLRGDLAAQTVDGLPGNHPPPTHPHLLLADEFERMVASTEIPSTRTGSNADLSSSCPTCGSLVRVVSGGEGTSHYEPIAAESRARCTMLADVLETLDDGGYGIAAAFLRMRFPHMLDAEDGV